MSNKEFVEELVNSLNKINRDPIRFRQVNDFRYKQKFVLKENIYKKLKAGENEFTIQIDLVLDTGSKEEIVVKSRYNSSPLKEEHMPEQLLNNIYNQVKLNILRYMLFAEECASIAGDRTQVVCIPVRQIMVEGYDNARKRIINESK